MYRRTVCVALALVAACKKGPISIKADGDKFVVEGSDVSGDLSIRSNMLFVHGIGDKGVVTLAGDKVVDGHIAATRFMGEQPLDKPTDKVPLHAPMTIELSDGRTATTTITGPVTSMVTMRPAEILAEVDAGKPLVFSREEATTARTIALLRPRYTSIDVFGPAKLVREIDLVARETFDALKLKSECRYQGGGFTFEAHDSKITLIERKTGKVVATTILPAAPLGPCPFTIRSDAQTSFGADWMAVRGWLNAQIGAAPGTTPRDI